jgi:hypothetical protein
MIVKIWLRFRLALLLATLFGFFATEFPDDATLTKFTIDARISASLAVIQTFLAVIIIHFLAMHAGFPIRVKTAIHGTFLVIF